MNTGRVTAAASVVLGLTVAVVGLGSPAVASAGDKKVEVVKAAAGDKKVEVIKAAL
ncbi:hypothetical protein [Streptomyces sp. NPDC014894]|uniref:hypothetical protein n=1 Tax=unclassified Streptomyces TaxID=2593676 RepID=UPI0036F5638F